MRFPAGLELVAVHAGAAADGAFVWLFVLGCLKRGDHGLFGDVVTVDVVEVAVPGLGGDRQQPHLGELRVIPVHPADDAGVRDPDRVRVGDRHRAFEGAGLLDPGDAGHFAVAVLRVEPGSNRVAGVVFASGVDRRDACPYFVALDQRLVADLDTWDVGDRVPWAWDTAERQAQRASARLARGGGPVRVGTHGCQGTGLPGGPAGWRASSFEYDTGARNRYASCVPPTGRRMATSVGCGAMAQLVARLHGMQKVRGSNPLSSTDFRVYVLLVRTQSRT